MTLRIEEYHVKYVETIDIITINEKTQANHSHEQVNYFVENHITIYLWKISFNH